MESRSERVSLFALLCAVVVWLGGTNVRSAVGFNLLIPWTLEFKPYLHPYVERKVYELVALSSAIVDIAYIIVWIAGIMFLRATSLKLKEHGWLMMSAILFYLFTPVEIYTMILDARIWLLDHIGSNDLVEYRILFMHRLGALAGVPLIALLCYYTVLWLVIFKPMRLHTQRQ